MDVVTETVPFIYLVIYLLYIVMYRTVTANAWYDTTITYAYTPKFKYKHDTHYINTMKYQ